MIIMFAKTRRWCRWVLVLFVACTLSAMSGDAAYAKPRKGLNDKILEQDTSKSYVLPYAVVILGVALGVMIVARPSTRAETVKRVIDDEEND
jgi:hypothetical protein